MASFPVIGQQFCAPAPLKLVLTSTSINGAYSAMDSTTGQILFRTETRFGFHDKRVLVDHANNILACFKAKALTLHNTWTVYRGFEPNENNLLMTVKDSSIFQLITGMDVFVAPNETSNPNFTTKGKYMAREYTITSASGQFIACGKRRRDVAHYIAEFNTYEIDVAAGADVALVVALFVIVDDIHADKNMLAFT